MNHAPLVSWVVPVFNGGRHLGEAIESILAQPHRPMELLVVDDGSTDGSAAVAERWGPLVRVIRQANAGVTAARNRGIAEAAGAFVAFADADDRCAPERLARQLERFAARAELAACFAHVQNFWSDELREEAARLSDHRLAQPIPGYGALTMVARRQAFETIGVFDLALHHSADTDWIMRARERGAALELLPEVLVYRRMHGRNLSRRRAQGSREEYLRLLKTSLDRRRRDGAL